MIGVQSHLGVDGIFRPIAGIAGKAAEHALRLAGTLTLLDDLNAPSITIEHMKNGIVLARFYLTEALRLLNGARTNPDLISAEKVLDWLRTREKGERMYVSLPEVYQFGPNVVRDKVHRSEGHTHSRRPRLATALGGRGQGGRKASQTSVGGASSCLSRFQNLISGKNPLLNLLKLLILLKGNILFHPPRQRPGPNPPISTMIRR
jgi:hypothetical protein